MLTFHTVWILYLQPTWTVSNCDYRLWYRHDGWECFCVDINIFFKVGHSPSSEAYVSYKPAFTHLNVPWITFYFCCAKWKEEIPVVGWCGLHLSIYLISPGNTADAVWHLGVNYIRTAIIRLSIITLQIRHIFCYTDLRLRCWPSNNLVLLCAVRVVSVHSKHNQSLPLLFLFSWIVIIGISKCFVR